MASLPRIAPMLGSPATCHRRGTEVHRLPGVDRHEVDRAYPDILVDMQRIKWDDQASMLLDCRLDVVYVRLPIDETAYFEHRRQTALPRPG